MMALHVTDAIVLHSFDYLESSRVLRLATRSSGIVSALARGARRSVKRFGSALDLFATGVAQLDMRPGRDLQTLNSFDVVNARSALATDLDRFAAATMLCELALRCSAGDEQGDVYEALVAAFDDLSAVAGSDARVTGLASAWRLIGSLGFAPTLDECSRCHRALDADADVLFSHVSGGAVCASCEGMTRGGRPIPASARQALGQWYAGGAAAVDDPLELRAHVRLLGEFIQRHVSGEADLRAFRAWTERLKTA